MSYVFFPKPYIPNKVRHFSWQKCPVSHQSSAPKSWPSPCRGDASPEAAGIRSACFFSPQRHVPLGHVTPTVAQWTPKKLVKNTALGWPSHPKIGTLWYIRFEPTATSTGRIGLYLAVRSEWDAAKKNIRVALRAWSGSQLTLTLGHSAAVTLEVNTKPSQPLQSTVNNILPTRTQVAQCFQLPDKGPLFQLGLGPRSKQGKTYLDRFTLSVSAGHFLLCTVKSNSNNYGSLGSMEVVLFSLRLFGIGCSQGY